MFLDKLAKLHKVFSELSNRLSRRGHELTRAAQITLVDRTLKLIGDPSDYTCHNVGETDVSFLCDRCNWGDPYSPNRLLRDANYCPNCGRVIVRRFDDAGLE